MMGAQARMALPPMEGAPGGQATPPPENPMMRAAVMPQTGGPTPGGMAAGPGGMQRTPPMSGMPGMGGKFGGQQMPQPVAPPPNYGAMGPRGSYNAQMAQFGRLQQQQALERARRQQQLRQPGPAWANPPAPAARTPQQLTPQMVQNGGPLDSRLAAILAANSRNYQNEN